MYDNVQISLMLYYNIYAYIMYNNIYLMYNMYNISFICTFNNLVTKNINVLTLMHINYCGLIDCHTDKILLNVDVFK